MSRRPELALDDELMVRKGEARGIAPVVAVTLPAPTEPRAPTPEPRALPPDEADYRPVVVGKRKTVERVYTNVRIPKDLDERLYLMLVETRRTKQDIIETFIQEGLDRYESSRREGQGA
jgi:hypothetical protein